MQNKLQKKQSKNKNKKETKKLRTKNKKGPLTK